MTKTNAFNSNISNLTESINSFNVLSKESSDKIDKNLETSIESLLVIFEELDKFKTDNNKSLIQI